MDSNILRTISSLLLAATLSGCAVQPTPPTAVHLLLLGEVHDNAQGHHQRYVDLRKRIVEEGWRPAIVMEQFDRENQAALTQAQGTCADAPCIIKAAGGTRWAWPLYEPLLALALKYHLPLIAGNVSRADAAIAMKQGFDAVFSPQTVDTFMLRALLPIDLVDGQQRAIEAGHCGKLPESLAQGMVRAQVARDVWMAKMLQDHAKPDAVLIAGNGHVRRDLGVPRWLRASDLVVTQVHGYVEPGDEGSAAVYDAIRTVAAQPRPDPCQAFAKPSAPGQPPSAQPKE